MYYFCLASLSNGTTVTNFASSGNSQFSILVLMAVVSIGTKKLDAILISLRGVVSIVRFHLEAFPFCQL